MPHPKKSNQTKPDTKIRHKIPLTNHTCKEKRKKKKRTQKQNQHELGIVENQAKQTCWSASQQPTYHLQASLCRQRLEPSLHALRQCCLVKILRLQLLTDPNCTHWTLPEDHSHPSSHHHLYPEIKNKNEVSIQIKNNTFLLLWSGKRKVTIIRQVVKVWLEVGRPPAEREFRATSSHWWECNHTREKELSCVVCVWVNETFFSFFVCSSLMKEERLERRLKKRNWREVWHGRDKRKEKAKYGGVWEERKWVGKNMAFLGSKGFLFSFLCSALCCSEWYQSPLLFIIPTFFSHLCTSFAFSFLIIVTV